MASSSNPHKSREAYKAEKELQEARKAGTAPPAIDSDGKIINPHIPEYISQAPWYLEQEGPSLNHQTNQRQRKRKFDVLGAWLPRGHFKGPPATKYRKGACQNCGAMTHSRRNCVERPRLRGANVTGKNICPDEVIGKVDLDFEGKRDRWNGYDESNFVDVHKRFAKLEHARKAVKAERLDKHFRTGKSNNNVDSDDEEKDGDGAVVQETGKAAKMAVRNLRIREDTAKYLYNLDLNSAYYDPKSRSMRADPRPNLDANSKDFAGDNFTRFTGDASTLAQMEVHAMRANEVGKQLPHPQAEPSRAEALFREIGAKRKELQEKRRTELLEKYGGLQHMQKEPGIEDVEQSEAYVEYNSEGKPISGTRDKVPVSMYPEDVYEKNHKQIWGSYYKNGQWGYGCCFQVQRYAFCTGEDGKKAAEETEKEMEKRVADAIAKRDPRPLREQSHGATAPKADEKEADADEERYKQIESERKMRRGETNGPSVEKHDGKAILGNKPDQIAEAEMEAYRLRKHMKDDPMAAYLGRGGR